MRMSLAIGIGVLASAGALAQSPPPDMAEPLADQSVSHLHPGGVAPGPDIANPLAGDPQAATRGMKNYINFNCVGCHAPNAGGGMGPSLSVSQRSYGDKPAQIFLSISQGRPNGMPAWGGMLPDTAIWELVAYIQSLAFPQEKAFGVTISRAPARPDIEQAPAEFQATVNPWGDTEPFSNGQAPAGQSKP